jgi:hypothetical protein
MEEIQSPSITESIFLNPSNLSATYNSYVTKNAIKTVKSSSLTILPQKTHNDNNLDSSKPMSNLKRLASLPLEKRVKKRPRNTAQNLSAENWTRKFGRLFSKKNSIRSICIETNNQNSDRLSDSSSNRINDEENKKNVKYVLVASEAANWAYFAVIIVAVFVLSMALICVTNINFD